MATDTGTMDKPRIVFLHGSGTNGDIFRLQARKLTALLNPHFTLIYPNAPIPCPPGPGVLPYFEGCEPFLTWMDDTSSQGEHAFFDDSSRAGGGGASSVAQVVEFVKSLGGVVGVVGFSMGAKVAMEVVRRLEEEATEEGEGEVKFVVAVCGTVPFQGGDETARDLPGRKAEEEGREEGFQEALARGVVKAQSVHLIGEADPWRAESEKLVDFFAEEGRTVIRFKGAHHMPADEAVNRQVVRIMLAACGKV